MAVDLLMDILNCTHLIIFDTADHGPAVMLCGGSAGLAAGGQICHVLFVDVGSGVGVGLPAPHELFGEIRGHIQVDG